VLGYLACAVAVASISLVLIEDGMGAVGAEHVTVLERAQEVAAE
jgi:hypothetical protein